MTKTRTESDSFGPIEVPSDRYWGAQTQRSVQNFPIGTETMPMEVVRGQATLKKIDGLLHDTQTEPGSVLLHLSGSSGSVELLKDLLEFIGNG